VFAAIGLAGLPPTLSAMPRVFDLGAAVFNLASHLHKMQSLKLIGLFLLIYLLDLMDLPEDSLGLLPSLLL
jgi:hypothetical protein